MSRSDMSISIHSIQIAVAAQWRCCVRDLLSRRQSQAVARPRQVAMWLARHATPASLPEIGRAFDRDHTTVMHGLEVVDALMARDPAFHGRVLRLLDEIAPEVGVELRAVRRIAA
jgi:chromosomal replication initiator protein